MISYRRSQYTILGLLLGLLLLFISVGTQFRPVAAQSTTIPLGSYVGVLNDPPTDPLFSVGQYQLTLLEGGKFRYEMNDKIIASGAYTLTTDRVEFTQPAGVGACASKGIYQWILQGNKLTLALPAGQSDACKGRTGLANTFFRTDQLDSLWRKIGPLGGSIYSLFAYEGKLFAGTSEGGIFVSENNGQSWRPTRTPKTFLIGTFAAFNGNLFAGGRGSLILVSLDGGENWQLYEPNLLNSTGFVIGDFAVFNGRLYAGAFGLGIIRATENPLLWEQVSTTGLTNLNVTALGAVGANLFASTDGGGVFVSTDGNTWTPVNNGFTTQRIYTLAVSGNTLYAGTGTNSATTNEVFFTQNNGQSWQRVGNGLASLPSPFLTNSVYKLLPLNGKLFAAHSNGVIVNEGGNWRTLYSWPFFPGCYALTGSGNQLFAGAWFDGVARSLDGGVTWSPVNSGLTGRVVNAVLKDNGVLYAGVGDGAFISVNEGQSWTRATTLPGPTVYNFLAFENKVYAGTNSGVYVTANQGQAWTRVSNGLPAGIVTGIAPAGNVLYASHLTGGVFRSPDGGQNWTAVNNGLTSLRVLSVVARGAMLLAGTANAGVFRSTNEGQNWTAVNNGLPAGSIFAMTFSGNTLLAAVYDQAIYRSTDSGDTWVKSANGVLHTAVNRMYANGNTVYASGNLGMGVIRSADNGQTWGFVNAGFDARFAYDFFVSGSTLYAAGPNGIYTSNVLANPLANVSAANYSVSAITEKSIVAMYGVNLATNVASAGTVPLPTSLLGTSVKIRDSNGVERLAPLFFVSGGQVNYQIPAGTATGTAIVSTVNGDGIGAISSLEVRAIAPSIFTADASGRGAAAALDAIKYTPAPFDPKLPNGDPNVIAVFGTGLGAEVTDGGGDVKAEVTARMDGNPVTLLYAGQAPGLVGANQFNVVLPATITSGVHTLTFTRGGVTSNTTTLAIR